MPMTIEEQKKLDEKVQHSLSELKRFRNATNNLEKVAYQLDGLACAFYATGNEIMCDKLVKLAQVINENIEVMNEVKSNEEKERYNDTMQNSANVINACFAGLKIGRETKDGH